jgi:hypothetical protein
MAVSSPIFKPIISVDAIDFGVQEDITVLGKVEIVLPLRTRSLTLRSRSECELKVSSSLNGPYITIKKKCSLSLAGLDLSDKIMYIESSIAVTVIETITTQG